MNASIIPNDNHHPLLKTDGQPNLPRLWLYTRDLVGDGSFSFATKQNYAGTEVPAQLRVMELTVRSTRRGWVGQGALQPLP